MPLEDEDFGARDLFEEIISDNQLRALSVGYELREFRYDQLVQVMFDALLNFSLNYSEYARVSRSNAASRIAKAAKTVYNTPKYGQRGEFGELLLHVLMRAYYSTIPAISKLYYKDSANDTVKGFDAVHVVVGKDGLELWVGEVKFYKDVDDAIRDVVAELNAHTTKSFLRGEFISICNKIDSAWPHAAKLRKLLDEKTSLDVVFSRMKIPVLITYNSTVARTYRQVDDSYRAAFMSETQKYHTKFRAQTLPPVDIVLFLLPLEDKDRLVNMLNQRLRAFG